MIIGNVLDALARGNTPLVLTHRTEHLERLAAGLTSVEHVLVMKGGMGKKQRRAAAEALASIPEGAPRVILATGSYIGEGFDDPRLDALFLTMPISWRGTLQQYVGRLHRIHDGKKVVQVVRDGECNLQRRRRFRGGPWILAGLPQGVFHRL
jgi:superfamily II DNA or RNA helicase